MTSCGSHTRGHPSSGRSRSGSSSAVERTDDMGSLYRFRDSTAGEQWIFKQEDPNNPEWCTESQPFIAWGEDRISGLARNPTDGNIVRLTAALVENYAERLLQAGPEHRPEKNNGTHRCLHEALFVLWRKIREIKLDRELPDLEPQVVMM